MAEAISLKKGQTLFLQGALPDGLFMLQAGTLELLKASDEFAGMDRDIILSRSTRVGVVTGKTVITGVSRLFTEPYCLTVRALEPATVAKYPLRKGGIKGIAVSDLNQSATLLKNMFTRLGQTQNDVAKVMKLYQSLARVNDNIHLIYKELSMSNAADRLVDEANRLQGIFQENGGALPEKVDMNFVISDNGHFLKKSYDLKSYSKELTDTRFLNIIKGILKLPGQILQQALKVSPEITLHSYDTMNDRLLLLHNFIVSSRKEIDTVLQDIFAEENSWASYLVNQKGYDEWLGSRRIAESFLDHFFTVINKFESLYFQLYGARFDTTFSGALKLKELKGEMENRAAKQKESMAASASSGGPVLKNTMSQIFEFSLLDKEFQKKFVKLLTDFKGLSNPFDTDSEGRKLRRHIAGMYWDLYKQVYVRSKSESTIPMSVNLMLNYGFLDDELMEADQLETLTAIAKQREHVPQEWVVREKEFLDIVHKGEEEPSITDMGQNYREFLRDAERYGTKVEDAGDDELLAKVLYEINQRVKSTSAVCSGSTATAFPILNSYNMKGDLNNFYVSKRQVVETVEEILKLDFSAFYRETVFKLNEDVREIIKEEVIPYIIQIPIFGTRILMWQELSGNNKRSRGRIVMPIFFLGDLKKAMAEAVAAFRWELNRTMKGGMWADPIEGGVTGEYFDYVNTYKKNSKLSPEAKERIKTRFKSLRNDRDKFADDYVTWLFYEYEGIMKMNAVTREMFFKHVPFLKEARERLGGMPAYGQMANRFKNLNAREIAAYERKFKKYEDENGGLPTEMQKFMDFLEL